MSDQDALMSLEDLLDGVVFYGDYKKGGKAPIIVIIDIPYFWVSYVVLPQEKKDERETKRSS